MEKKNVFMALMFCLVLFNMEFVFASTWTTMGGWMTEFGKKLGPYITGFIGIFLFPVAFGFFRKLLSIPMQFFMGFVIAGVMVGSVGVLPSGIGSSARDFINKFIGRIGG